MISFAPMAFLRSFSTLVILSGTYQSAFASRLPVQRFTTAEGLPRNSVRCITPGRTGVMWVCTSEGLVRYDGSGFRVFGQESGLPSNSITDLVSSRSGGFWVVTLRGLCKLENNARISEPCRVVDGSAPSGGSPAVNLFESSTGRVWYSVGSSLFEVITNAKGVRSVRAAALVLPDGNAIQCIGDAPNGALYIGASQGLFEFQATPVRKLRRIGSGSNQFWGISDMIRLPDGSTWLATSEGPARLFPGEQQELRRATRAGTGAHSLILRRDGSVWFAADRWGLIRIDPKDGSRQDLTAKEGLPNDYITHVAEDSYGDLWGATSGSGVFRIEESAIRSYYGGDGLGGPLDVARIASIFEDRQKRLCVLTSWDNGNLRVFSDGAFKPVPIAYPPGFRHYGWGSKQNGFQAHDGEWWFPTGDGLLRYSATEIEHLPQARLIRQYRVFSGLGFNDLTRAFEDSHGDIWVMCMYPVRSLARWSRQKDEFHVFGSEENWDPSHMATLIREPRPGEVWVITNLGFSRFRNGRFESVAFDADEVGVVFDAVFDRAGRLWIATARAGLLRYDHPEAPQPRYQAYTVKDGLSINGLRALTFDRDGFLYASTTRGVDRIDPNVPIGKQYVRHFTAADGLPNSEHSVSYTDSSGRLWFGTLGGLAEFDPSRALKLGPPSIFLTRVRVRGEEVPLEWEGSTALKLDLAPDRNQLEVTFSGTDTRPMASLRYQYRLTGVDRDWSPPTELTTVNYTTLPAGSLRFEVRSFNADGSLSTSVAGIDLNVAAPFWRRWWFILSLATLVAFGIWSFQRNRLRQLMAIERLRLRIATELHDDIGANLSQIAILTEVARRDDSQAMLAEVPVIARETVELMSDIVWAVNPEHDGFDALLQRMRRFASDTLGAADIQLDFPAPDFGPGFVMPLEVRRPIYLVFKEAIHNIAKHSGANAAGVRFSLEGSSMRMEISDNGRGFDSSKESSGDGLSNIARRMREAHGSAVWDTAPNAGTRMTARIPLH